MTGAAAEVYGADDVLDDAVRASLTGAHARFAQRHGRALRYDPQVAPFVALEDDRDPAAWEDRCAQGLAGCLVRAVAAGAVARGELPFLHVLASNGNALSLDRGLGFEVRRTMAFGVFARVPLDG